MGAAAAGLMVAGTVLKAGAGVSAGFQARRAALENANRLEEAALGALRRGDFEEGVIRRREARVVGETKATLAASGVLVDRGSAADIVRFSRMNADLDATMTRLNAEREALGFLSDAEKQRRYGKRAVIGALFGAAGTAARGASGLFKE